MPKFPTFPTLYDEVLQLSTTKLKEWGYLTLNNIETASITWSSNGSKRAEISIMVCTLTPKAYILLSYNFKDEPRKYEIQLTHVPSNLGKGEIWYFICPQTNRRCRKLYSIGGYFLHREAFNGCMYESQTHSKKYRQIESVYGAYFNLDRLYDQIYKKHFKKTYDGKLTKRYKKILAQLERGEKISQYEIEQLYIN